MHDIFVELGRFFAQLGGTFGSDAGLGPAAVIGFIIVIGIYLIIKKLTE